MTVSTTSNKVVYQGNGATTSFAFPFAVPLAAWLQVIYTDPTGAQTTLTPNLYSVSGIGVLSGGFVTYPLAGAPIPSTASLLIQRVVPYQQTTSLGKQANYFPDVVEGALDNLEYQIQQVAGSSSLRALVFPATDVNPQTQLPAAAARANLLLGFDASGNPHAVGVPAAAPVIANVFNFMTVAQIFSVQARNFAVDVAGALSSAFAAGVGQLPPGGYACSTSVAVSGANGLGIYGTSAAEVELRFGAGQNGLAISFSDPVTVPSVRGVTITTLTTGPLVSGIGLSVTMAPTVGTAFRGGVRIADVVIRGADPTLHGWDTCAYLNGLWYPNVDHLTVKGYSAIGAALNTYQTTYGIHLNGVMVPRIDGLTAYHVNTGIFEDSASNAAEGLDVLNFEIVGCNTGISLGSGVATPIPGGSIGPGHINASTRGIVLNNRVQCEVHGVLFYRTTATTAAWVAVQVSTSDHNFFHDLTFENSSADVTGGIGLWFTGTSSYNRVSGLLSDNWNAAGEAVLLDNSSDNNVIDAYSIKCGPTGTVWSKVVNNSTGTHNRINDTEATATVLTANSATPSVGSALSGDFSTLNTIPTSITNFTNGYKGQVIRVTVGDANTTFIHNGTTIALRAASNQGCDSGDVISFRNVDGTLWRQVSAALDRPTFATVAATGQLISSQATGTAPLVISSTTKVANLNVDMLDGTDWTAPGPIGGTTPSTAAFTTVTASVSHEGPLGAGTPAAASVTTLTASGDFTETGLAKRFKADFSNATRANRFIFQDATSGNPTNIVAMPNGVGNGSSWVALGLSDPANTHEIRISASPSQTTVNSTIAGTGTQRDLELQIAGVTKARIDVNGNVILGVSAALATTATNGFPYIETCAGPPTGVPTAVTGMVPMVYDTTNNKLWIYNGAWKGVVLA